MLITVSELQGALHDLFNDTARQLAHDTGFCQRERFLNGPAFAKTVVFCLLERPNASLDDFADFATEQLDLEVTASAFSERFTLAAARFFLELFLESFDRSFNCTRTRLLPLLRRFNGVYVRDATTIGLPPSLAQLFPGRPNNGINEPTAAVKLVLELEVSSGQFTEACFLAGTDNDRTATVAAKPLPPGALLLEDMGFLSGDRLQWYISLGVYVLTRVPNGTAFFVKKGNRFEQLNLLKWLRRHKGSCVQRPVYLFHEQKVALRLLAVRVPEEVAEARRERVRQEAKKRKRPVSQKKLDLCAWNILVTNAPRQLLSVYEAFDVRRVRWQVELVFKVFKSEGGLAGSRAEKSWRVLCELYAKLLAQVVQQWLLLAAGYRMLRHSVRRAARRVRRVASQVLRALSSVEALAAEVVRLAKILDKRCRIPSRKFQPTTFDRLYDLDAEFRLLDQAA
jgi:hypothetical protein